MNPNPAVINDTSHSSHARLKPICSWANLAPGAIQAWHFYH